MVCNCITPPLTSLVYGAGILAGVAGLLAWLLLYLGSHCLVGIDAAGHLDLETIADGCGCAEGLPLVC